MKIILCAMLKTFLCLQCRLYVLSLVGTNNHRAQASMTYENLVLTRFRRADRMAAGAYDKDDDDDGNANVDSSDNDDDDCD